MGDGAGGRCARRWGGVFWGGPEVGGWPKARVCCEQRPRRLAQGGVGGGVVWGFGSPWVVVMVAAAARGSRDLGHPARAVTPAELVVGRRGCGKVCDASPGGCGRAPPQEGTMPARPPPSTAPPRSHAWPAFAGCRACPPSAWSFLLAHRGRGTGRSAYAGRDRGTGPRASFRVGWPLNRARLRRARIHSVATRPRARPGHLATRARSRPQLLAELGAESRKSSHRAATRCGCSRRCTIAQRPQAGSRTRLEGR